MFLDQGWEVVNEFGDVRRRRRSRNWNVFLSDFRWFPIEISDAKSLKANNLGH